MVGLDDTCRVHAIMRSSALGNLNGNCPSSWGRWGAEPRRLIGFDSHGLWHVGGDRPIGGGLLSRRKLGRERFNAGLRFRIAAGLGNRVPFVSLSQRGGYAHTALEHDGEI